MNGRAMARIERIAQARATTRRRNVAQALADAAPDAVVAIEGDRVIATMRDAARRRATDPALRMILEHVR